MRSYPVKENPIGSAVSEILWYKQTDTQTKILLLYYKDHKNLLSKINIRLNSNFSFWNLKFKIWGEKWLKFNETVPFITEAQFDGNNLYPGREGTFGCLLH